MATEISFKSLKGKDHSKHQGVDGRIILKRILRKKYVGARSRFIWLREGAGGRTCKHGNKRSEIHTRWGKF
jgi:hypothetical protein